MELGPLELLNRGGDEIMITKIGPHLSILYHVGSLVGEHDPVAREPVLQGLVVTATTTHQLQNDTLDLQGGDSSLEPLRFNLMNCYIFA